MQQKERISLPVLKGVQITVRISKESFKSESLLNTVRMDFPEISRLAATVATTF